MDIQQITVTPEVAKLRQNDGGQRRCTVVHTFSKEPLYFAGEIPAEIAEDPHLVVRDVPADELARLKTGRALVHAAVSARDLFPVAQVEIRTPPGAAKLLETIEALEKAEDLRQLYEWVLGEPPHGNKGKDGLREDLRDALSRGGVMVDEVPLWVLPRDLDDAYGEAAVTRLADLDKDKVRDLGVVEAAIRRASGRARSRLLTRYQTSDLPQDPAGVPEALRRVVVDLAWYELHKRNTVVSDAVEKLEKDAMDELRDIVNGPASLGLAGSPPVDSTRATIVTSPSRADRLTWTNLDLEGGS